LLGNDGILPDAGGMRTLSFQRLNEGWNAQPNAPNAQVHASGFKIQLRFVLNSSVYEAEEDELGCLTFQGCSAWRLGPTNDEGWYRGQCRYSETAPAWGDFYELLGEDALRTQPDDWQIPALPGDGDRHFLFYLRDDTFECFAADWIFERGAACA
jgi:hypothetical protein